MFIGVLSSGANLALGTEAATTPVAGANDTALGSTNAYFTFLTMPSTAALFQVTGLEVSNGTVVAGNFAVGIYSVDANPPTIAFDSLLGYSALAAQAGTSAVQRISYGHLPILYQSQLVGLAVKTTDATARFGTTTVGSRNGVKNITIGATPANGDAIAWSAQTEEPYIKMYYKPLT